MESKIIHPFPIPIFSSQIDSDTFKKIKQEVLHYIKKYPNNFKEVWNCPTKSNLGVPSSKNIKSPLLENTIKKSTESYFNHWGFNPINLILKDIWINISPPGSYQESHKHTNYKTKVLFSGVFYIDVQENSGELILISPIENQIFNMLPSKYHNTRYNIQPINGSLISFPAWMDHLVLQNKSHNNRISVSWNIEAIPICH